MSKMSEEERESVEAITEFAHSKLKEFGVSGTVTVAIFPEGDSFVHCIGMNLSEINTAINALKALGGQMIKETVKEAILEGMFDEHS